MSETKKDKQLFTVGRVFFLLIVIPLSLVALLIANGIFKLGETARKQAVTVLDNKSQEEIKVRAINVADEVADFLRERQRDVIIASILPTTEAAFKEFVNGNKKALWVNKDGNVLRVLEPLYSEIALIGRTGDEMIKIAGGETVPKIRMVNVSLPSNTTYKSEDYFARTKALNKGEVYVSHITGWYVTKEDFLKVTKRDLAETSSRFYEVMNEDMEMEGRDGAFVRTCLVALKKDLEGLEIFRPHGLIEI